MTKRRLISPLSLIGSIGRTIAASAGAAALVLGLLGFGVSVSPGRAVAQEHGGGGHGGGGSGHDGGHDDGGHDDGHESGGSGWHGGKSDEEWLLHRGGDHADGEESHSDSEHAGRGGRNAVEELVFRREGGRGAGQGRGGGMEDAVFGDHGRPAWAGGAVPEDIELGRLNAGRAPQSVRDRALEEAYRNALDRDGDGQIDPDADLTAVESPNANLALYQQAVGGEHWTLDDAATFLGRAADKNLPIAAETLFAVHTILGLEDPELVFAGYGYDRAARVDAATLAAVFGGENATASGVSGFAQAADDVRAIEKYQHDHPSEALIN